jgi:hypothetical protein
MRIRTLTIAILLTGLILGACSPPTDPLDLGREAEAPAGQEARAPTATLHPTVEPSAAPVTTEPYEGPVTPLPMDMLPTEAEALVSQVRADLAERLSLPLTAVQLRSAEAVIWPDASLGCPQPGQMYAQIETPGYRITLVANGTDHEYHASHGGQFVLCVAGHPWLPSGTLTPGDIKDGSPWLPVEPVEPAPTPLSK